MSSASKALELLSLFSKAQPEIGLSDMGKLAKRDKATTYRHLQILEAAGFVEQNVTTKHYRLGPTLLQLGRMREATVPRKAGAEAPVHTLADKTGETAHVSVLSGTSLFALVSCESPKHSTRAVIDITTFPLHATASGFCALAFGPECLFDTACKNLSPYTDVTPTTPDMLQALIDEARATGFARSEGRFESEIHSLSAPIFDQTGGFSGAVSVASVASRFAPELERIIMTELIMASRDITKSWGGIIPPSVEIAWSNSIASQTEVETTS
ncbi:IclR family transcriptional regulator [Roseovarius sp. LXJ103]|uniref:IclR family transcriptional regulator n=1 Tax=Roseovarius carneus TaxID=2853164 RepID=UPI000D609263|nr:IclR family transcriptional regulator [Roseovarius carneus]MBZ8117736.1 IclR family transcriptional regulator [Roseovarius carneus]PWE36491.1 IclR family transcriptional regulator [Pelagicola sp. LXJ1103]